MASPLTNTTRSNAPICILWLWGAILFGFSQMTCAQMGTTGPIRVESKDVLVPVLVLDKKRADQIRSMGPGLFSLEARKLTNVEVSDLTAKDFRIFDGGKEQKIERLTLQPDSLIGFTAAGVGKWVAPDPPDSGPGLFTAPPHWVAYLIAYAQPPSAKGSCHQIAVKVDRPDSLVYTRAGYCNWGNSAADPLGGTKLEDQMASILNLGKPSRVSLPLTTFSSFRDADDVVTNVVLGFPENSWRAFKCDKPPTMEVLGIAYAKHEGIAARFSDLENLGSLSFVGETIPNLAPITPGHCIDYVVPYQYETQIKLTPGEYTLRVAFKDGKKFGRAETAFVVPTFDKKRLAISDVTFSRRYRKVSSGPQDDTTVLPGAYVPLVSKGFEVTPTADARFKKSEPLDFYFEVYAPQPEHPVGAIEAHLRIQDAKTGQVVKDLQPVDAAPYAKPGDPIIPVGGAIDISGLPSGSYRLEVQATDSVGNATTWRAADFTIE